MDFDAKARALEESLMPGGMGGFEDCKRAHPDCEGCYCRRVRAELLAALTEAYEAGAASGALRGRSAVLEDRRVAAAAMLSVIAPDFRKGAAALGLKAEVASLERDRAALDAADRVLVERAVVFTNAAA